MRIFLTSALLSLAVAFPAVAADSAGGRDSALTPPKGRPIKVAVVLSDMATVIDFAGPWEVFQDTAVPAGDGSGETVQAFELYTVASSTAVVHTTGANHLGLAVTPDYSFEDAPAPDLVVIGAQKESPGMIAWLQKVNAAHGVILGVCTGNFKVAKAGLYAGREATTHHDFFDAFAKQFPDVKLVKTSRFVQASPLLYSAGGLTSGIDGALHIVAGYFGDKIAQQTADYMEYQSSAWKTNVRGVFKDGAEQ